jgi:hypothetical protein
MLTKPPPKPPQFVRHSAPLAPKQFDLPVKQLPTYRLPMHTDDVPAWVDVLQRCGYPTDVLVIDFETYFDAEYRMSRNGGDGLTTIEYVRDQRFEELGCAFTEMTATAPFAEYTDPGRTFFQAGEEMVATQLACYQKRYGDNLERCTVVFQNAGFDGLILSGVRHPPAVRRGHPGLARALEQPAEERSIHSCKRSTCRRRATRGVRGLTFRRRYRKPKGRKKGPKLPVQVPVITPEQVERLRGYACNDAMREWELFTILLPKLSRPATSFGVMQAHARDVLEADARRGLRQGR